MKILLYPIATEKAISEIEKNNTITFIVNDLATKKDIKEEFEKLFGVKVEEVRVARTKQGKKAFIKLSKEFKAEDIALKLKLL
jgi:large subunit ribosomal protein L23